MHLSTLRRNSKLRYLGRNATADTRRSPACLLVILLTVASAYVRNDELRFCRIRQSARFESQTKRIFGKITMNLRWSLLCVMWWSHETGRLFTWPPCSEMNHACPSVLWCHMAWVQLPAALAARPAGMGKGKRHAAPCSRQQRWSKVRFESTIWKYDSKVRSKVQYTGSHWSGFRI